MAFARDVDTATASQTDFTISFAYLDEADVLVYADGVLQTQGATDDYTIVSGGSVVRFNTGLSSGTVVVIQRSTSQSTRLVDYATASTLTEADMDNDSLQAFYMSQEAIDIANLSLGLDSNENWDAESKRITNVATPTASTDAVTKAYADSQTGNLPVPTDPGDDNKFPGALSGEVAWVGEATIKSRLNLEIGTDVQAWDATLDSISGLGTAADKIAYTTGVDTWAEAAITSVARQLLDDSSFSAMRTTLGLAIGSDVQAYDADTAKTDVVQSYSAGQAGNVTTLSDGANISINLNSSNNFKVTLGGNRTLDNPSNMNVGQSGVIEVIQDGTGSRTLSFGTYYKFAGGVAPTLTTDASAVDTLHYYVRSSTEILISSALDWS